MPVFIPPQSPIPNVFNYAPQNLKKWRAALAGVKAGAASARLLLVGDSTSFGAYSNGNSSGNYQPLMPATQLAALFTAAGVNAHSNSWMGAGSTSGLSGQIGDDSRITYSTDWSINTASDVTSAGGYSATASTASNNSGYLSFKPTVNVDTFNIFFVGGLTGTRHINWNLNGGSNTSVSASTGSNVIQVATATGTLGSNTLNVASNVDGSIFVQGMEAYDSSKKWVSVINAGFRGALVSNWIDATHTYGPLNGISVIAPNLTLLNLTINDWNANTALATYISGMQSIINTALASGDVVLVTGNPSNPSGNASAAQQQQFVNAAYQLAQTNSLVLVDIFGRWMSYANSPTLYGDGNLHPNGVGYADIARAIMNVIGNP